VNQALTNTAPFNNFRGYYVKDANHGTNVTIDFEGKLVNTDLSVSNLTYTSGSNQGFHLIANPYTAALEWSTICDSSSGNYSGTIYQRDNSNASKLYTAYNVKSNTYINKIGDPNIIPPGQAFWIEVKGSANSFAIIRADRIHENEAFRNNKQFARIYLQVQNEDSLSDEMAIVFTPFTTNNYDPLDDATKMFADDPSTPQIYAVVEGNDVCINHLNENDFLETETVEIKINCVEGSNQVSWRFENMDLQLTPVLEDLIAGEFTDLNSKEIYSFLPENGETTRDFLLHLFPPTQPFDTTTVVFDTNNTTSILENNITENIYVFGKNIYFQTSSNTVYQVFDMTGKLVLEGRVDEGFTRISTTLSKGIYLIKLNTETLIGKRVFID
jgi:hypothetical protein